MQKGGAPEFLEPTDIRTLSAAGVRDLSFGGIQTVKMPDATYHEISVCAYCIWVQEGRPEGRALDHWVQAELQLVLSSILRKKDQRNERKKDAPLPIRRVPLPAPAIRDDISLAQPSIRRAADDFRV